MFKQNVITTSPQKSKQLGIDFCTQSLQCETFLKLQNVFFTEN